MPSRSLPIAFRNRDGEQLAARLELPDAAPLAYAIFAHCFTCSKNALAATRIARALGARGFAVLRFDFTGLGNSEGDFGNTNFSSNVEDLLAAAGFLRSERQAPRLLIGHSLGGSAVLAVASEIPEIEAVVTLGAPSDPRHVLQHLGSALETIERDGFATVSLGGRPFTVKRQFVEDLEEQRLLEIVQSLHRALLVLHSPQDEIVEIRHAAQIFQAALHPKSFVSLDGADHLLTNPADSDFVAAIVAAWAARYVTGQS